MEPIQLILYGLAALFLLLALFFFMRSLSARMAARNQFYNVLRTSENRRVMRRLVNALLCLFLGLILLPIAFAVGQSDRSAETAVLNTGVEIPLTPDSSAGGVDPAPQTQPEISLDPDDGAPAFVVATETPFPELVPQSPTETPAPPTETPIPPTPSPAPLPGVVNSPVVGIYLRDVPGGEILELLPHETEVVIVPEEQIFNDLVWVKAIAPSGAVGWLAADFMLIGEAIPTPTVVLGGGEPITDTGTTDP